MAFLIELEDENGVWAPVSWEDDRKKADTEVEGALKAMPGLMLRITELDIARMAFRFAERYANVKLQEYLEANARAHDLKVKIRPAHWPEEMQETVRC